MRVVAKKYRRWDKNTKRNLMRATFPDGFMRRYVKIDPESQTFVAFSEKQIMGWVLFFADAEEMILISS